MKLRVCIRGAVDGGYFQHDVMVAMSKKYEVKTLATGKQANNQIKISRADKLSGAEVEVISINSD